MKKILLVLGSLFIGVTNVFAFTDNFVVKKDGFLCSEGKIYEVFDMSQDGLQYYHLYPDDSYDFDMRDYREISFEDGNINVLVKDFGYNNNLYHDNDKLNLFIQKMIWEYTTNKEYYICDKELNALYYPESYNSVYSYILNFQKRPSIPERVEIVYGTKEVLSTQYLDHYEITGLDELDYERLDTTHMSVTGEIGSYNISFIKTEVGEEKLYFNGENYLMPSGMRSYQKFDTEIIIDNPTLVIQNGYADDVDLPKTSLCFRLYNKDFDQNFCADEDGIAKIKAPMGIYKLEMLTDLNNSFNEDNIVLKTFTKEINIFWSEGAIKDEPSSVQEIIPSDTLEYGGIIFLSLIFLGVFLVVKKNKTN